MYNLYSAIAGAGISLFALQAAVNPSPEQVPPENIGKRVSFTTASQNAPRLLLQSGHAARIDSLQSDRQGRLLLTASSHDRSVILWDIKTGTQLDRFHGSSGTSVANWLPNQPTNNMLALFGGTDGVQIVDLNEGRVVRKFNGEMLATSPAGAVVMATSEYSKTSDGASKLDRQRIEVFDHSRTDALWSANLTDGMAAHAAVDETSQACLYDFHKFGAQADKEFLSIFSVDIPHRSQVLLAQGYVQVEQLELSSGGKRALVTYQDRTVELWDLQKPKRIFTLRAQLARLSVDGQHLLILDDASQLRLLEFDKDGQEREAYSAPSFRVSMQRNIRHLYGFSLDGKYFSYIGKSGNVTICATQSGATQSGATHYTGPPNAIPDLLAFAPADRCYIVVGSSVIHINLIDSSLREFATGNGIGREYRIAALRPGREEFLTAAIPGKAILWDLHGMRKIREFDIPSPKDEEPPDFESIKDPAEFKAASGKFFLSVISNNMVRPSQIGFSRDGEKLLIASPEFIDLRDVSSGKLIKRWHCDQWPVSIDVGVGGIDAVASYHDGTSAAYSKDMDAPVVTIKGSMAAEAIPAPALTGPFNGAFSGRMSPDARWHISAKLDHTLVLKRIQDGTERTLPGHKETVSAAVFTQNNEVVVTGAEDGSVIAWRCENGDKLGERKLSSGVLTLASYADSRRIMVGLNNETVCVCDVIGQDHGFTVDGVLDGFCGTSIRPSDKYFLTRNWSGDQFLLWNSEKGHLEAEVRMIANEDQLAVTSSDGRFDLIKLDGSNAAQWVFPDDPMRPLKQDVFMRDYYEPRLLARILSAEHFPPLRPMYSLNRVQPSVKIVSVEPVESPSTARVSVHVAATEGSYTQNGREVSVKTDVYDLRLFRNGQLVARWPDPQDEPQTEPDPNSKEQMDRWRDDNRVPLTAEESNPTFEVKLPYRQESGPVEFTAYAFNVDRVKSETARFTYNAPATDGHQSRAYLICMGVGATEGQSWDLSFAADDVRLMHDALRATLGKASKYEIVPVLLLSERNSDGAIVQSTATKENLRAALAMLAGEVTKENVSNKLPHATELHPATPDDLLIIAFSGHGYTDSRGNLYLVPFDVGLNRIHIDEALPNCISTRELSGWLRKVDASDVALIIDACHAAAAVPEGFKPGPLGGRGLGQLAYDKGMRVLAASQAEDVAIESRHLKHGLLTYALFKDGLEQRRAELDGKITLRGLFEYATGRVPVLYEEVLSGKVLDGEGAVARNVEAVRPKSDRRRLVQRPELFDYFRGTDVVLNVQN